MKPGGLRLLVTAAPRPAATAAPRPAATAASRPAATAATRLSAASLAEPATAMVAASAAAVLACLIAPVPAAMAATAPSTCTVHDPRVSEASGLVVLPDGRRVVHNDSGDSARYFVLAGCSVTAEVRLPGITARDWEDVALGPAPGGGPVSLWFADTGNNRLVDRDVSLVVTPLPAGGTTGRRTAAATVYRLSLPQGPEDIEALVVDPNGGGPALISKSPFGVAHILVPSAALSGNSTVALRSTGSFSLSPTGTPGGPVRGFKALAAQVAVTGAVLSRDGRTLVVRTYTDLYDWAVPAGAAALGERLAQAAQGQPGHAALVPRHQGEGIGLEPGGGTVVLITEGDDTAIDTLALPKPGPPTATGSTASDDASSAAGATTPRAAAHSDAGAATPTIADAATGTTTSSATINPTRWIAGGAVLAAAGGALFLHLRLRGRSPRR